MPGVAELIVVLAIVLVVFGAKRLPDIGRSLGASIRNFRSATKPDGDDLQLSDGG